MLTISLISVIVILIGVVIALSVKGDKEQAKQTPAEAAAEITRDEKRKIVSYYSGTDVAFKFGQNIKGLVTNLRVTEVDVFGTRYSTVETALKNKLLSEGESFKLAQFEEELKIVRKEREASNPAYHLERTAFDGKVYIYRTCKVELGSEHRSKSGLPARIGIQIEKDNAGQLFISTVFVAKDDVKNESNRYKFDLLDNDDFDSFKMLVATDKEYAIEMHDFEVINSRLAHYNQIVKEGRVDVVDGKIELKPPKPEHIKARRAKALQEMKDKKEESAPVDEVVEAKEQVEEEFISSVDAI